MKDSTHLLSLAIEAALKAGIAIMDVYEGDDFNVEIKGDNSPLTKADIIANKIINSFLVPTNIPIISEENRQTDYVIREKWKTCWIVDPVDGTKEFIKRNGEFTVNIALVENGKPILGVIYAPVTKTLYFGDVLMGKGRKVCLKSHNTSFNEVLKKAIPLIPKWKESKKIQVVGSRSHMNQETLNYIQNLKTSGKEIEIVSKGSSLKFCLMAEGKAAVYPRFAPTMEWDTAAGQAICESVSINVISLENNKPLMYNKENLLNPWFISENNFTIK
jgi:3'(2'), 5'-bisphosphate nucleotidase